MLFLQKIIKTVKPVLPWKYYENEEGVINPAYAEVEHSCLLKENEKSIWALRSDMILSMGKKDCQKYGQKYKNLFLNQFDENDAQHEDFKNYYNSQYGHPSLAVPHDNYDGGVIYAGWVAQRKECVEILMCSGRFHQFELTDLQKECLELYVAKKYIDLQGDYDVIFYDWAYGEENEHLFFNFLDDKKIQSNNRKYTPDYVNTVFLLEKYNIGLSEIKLKTLKESPDLCHELVLADKSSDLSQQALLSRLDTALLDNYISERNKITHEHSGWCSYIGSFFGQRKSLYGKSNKINTAETMKSVLSGNLKKLSDNQVEALENGNLNKYYLNLSDTGKKKIDAAISNSPREIEKTNRQQTIENETLIQGLGRVLIM